MIPLTFAAIGCGSRVSTYAKLICSLPQKSKIVACADPKPERLELMSKITGDSSMLTFPGADELLAQGKLADVMIIGTQDAFHAEPCIKAMELGYDVLMEKPIATNFPEVIRLEQEAKRLGRRVLICHVLRYTPFYGKIKSLLEAGTIGEITSINAIEGVGPFHQAHSYVRGHDHREKLP
jgi:predicted dehydrogenase